MTNLALAAEQRLSRDHVSCMHALGAIGPTDLAPREQRGLRFQHQTPGWGPCPAGPWQAGCTPTTGALRAGHVWSAEQVCEESAQACMDWLSSVAPAPMATCSMVPCSAATLGASLTRHHSAYDRATMNTQKLLQVPETAAGPKERAGLMEQPSLRRSVAGRGAGR